MIGSNFIFNFTNLCVIVSFFLTRLIILIFFFSIAARAVAKLLILGISFLTSCILSLRAVVVPKLVILGICFLTLFILALRVDQYLS